MNDVVDIPERWTLLLIFHLNCIAGHAFSPQRHHKRCLSTAPGIQMDAICGLSTGNYCHFAHAASDSA